VSPILKVLLKRRVPSADGKQKQSTVKPGCYGVGYCGILAFVEFSTDFFIFVCSIIESWFLCSIIESWFLCIMYNFHMHFVMYSILKSRK
jgi:hypothetical protein